MPKSEIPKDLKAKFCLNVEDGQAKAEIYGTKEDIINLLVNFMMEEMPIMSIVTLATAIAHRKKEGKSTEGLDLSEFDF